MVKGDNMIRVVQFDRYGPPEVLATVDAPAPEPAAGQVRLKVRAAGVQPFDCATRRGDFQRWRPLELPGRLGNEVAGTVEAVGDGVGVQVGDDLIAYLDQEGYASHVVVDVEQTAPKPASMPWNEAGALSVSGQTAFTALDALDVGPGDRLLIHAAAGGVGSAAVQLAVIRGATVIGTASERNHEYLRSIGAVPVAYGPGLADRVREAAPDGITSALDAVGGEALDVSLELLGSPERIVTIADWMKSSQMGIRRVGTERSPEKLRDLTRWFEEGLLSVRVAREYPLEQAHLAHRDVETGHVNGKVVLVA